LNKKETIKKQAQADMPTDFGRFQAIAYALNGEEPMPHIVLINPETDFVYLRQEGRGIGIINKLHAYVKQDEGFDTAEANRELGFEYDQRTYEDAVSILEDLGVTKINLLTNNPEKIKGLDNCILTVEKRIPVEIPPKTENLSYLQTKKDFFGHQLDHL